MYITEDMLIEINNNLRAKKCIFKIISDKDDTFKIVPLSNIYIDSIFISLSPSFYEYLREYFKNKGIAIDFNNDRSVFWSI